MKKKLVTFSLCSLICMLVISTGCKHHFNASQVRDSFAAYQKCHLECEPEDGDEGGTTPPSPQLQCIIDAYSTELIQRQVENCRGDGACLGEIGTRVRRLCAQQTQAKRAERKKCIKVCEQVFEKQFTE